MRSIAIVGAGQAGLQLALALRQRDYEVSLYSAYTAGQILSGRILSSQGMFESALKIERALGLNYWDMTCPKNIAVTFTSSEPSHDKEIIFWQGQTQYPYQSVDQRLKFSRWMQEFQSLHGNLVIQEIGKGDLEKITNEHELTIVATGKGELGGIFQRNAELSSFTAPQRFLSCLYLQDVEAALDAPGIRINMIPGIGEYFIMPGLSLNGPCEMMLFEGLPEGPFDCWRGLSGIEEQLEISLALLKKYVPWEAERCQKATPTDPQAFLAGGYTPVIKHPVCQLNSGNLVLGLGDAVVLNDPAGGQGANNASKAAHIYAQNILNHGSRPFDEQWMHQIFNQYWNQCAQRSSQLSNILLDPPAPHVLKLLKSASTNVVVANAIANAFDRPDSLFPWILSDKKTEAFIEQSIVKKTLLEDHDFSCFTGGQYSDIRSV